MLTITVPGTEMYNDETEEFVTIGDVVLELEHSLVSLSKWESEFEKPFISKEEKTPEEAHAYVKAMVLTENVPEEVLSRLSEENFSQIQAYIESANTATTIHEPAASPSRQIITSELIYYWMTMFSVPIECENWHLNRLFTLLKIHELKNAKPNKRGGMSEAAERRRLNEKRLKQYDTSG